MGRIRGSGKKMHGCVIFSLFMASPFPSPRPTNRIRLNLMSLLRWKRRRSVLANGLHFFGARFAEERMSMRGDGRIQTACMDTGR